MLSNATWTACIRQYHRKRRLRTKRRGPSHVAIKEKQNENQSDERLCRRPREGSALLYGSAGVCQENRFQSGALPLADRVVARGAERHRATVSAEQQSRDQNVPAGDLPTEPAS